ncbi:oligosaccharide repeat unit polymerase [Bacillus aerolatus]|uniref:Oligosaccharide repeat unit polymerase n=1 Tax=Bacillus aerolatus TaxID=2653354 RepID=A0A6I1FMA8_9BACI|nr:oligosaccharide repeat unit polymerase [Bacillus aerolatus]KAB7707401.1 oligosaccharide repeat unit polymerase [Bacillus aerolatus]
MIKIKIITFIFLTTLKFLLEYSYVAIINPIFAYEGFILYKSYPKMFESYILASVVFLIAIFLLEHKKAPSKIVIYLIIVLLFIPLTSLFWLQDQPRPFIYLISLSLFLIILIVSLFSKIHLVRLKEGKNLIMFIVGGMTVIVYGLLIAQGGLSRINLNLSEIYSVREAYGNTNNKVLAYLLPWQAHVINMLVIAVSMYKRNYKLAGIFIVLQVFLFSMTNFKSFLFAPLVLIGFHLFGKTKLKNNLLLVISLGSSLLVAVCVIIYNFSGSFYMASIFIRRLFFVPSNLHYIYYHFFQGIEKFKLSHSFLGFLNDNVYNSTPVQLVATSYFEREFAPNVGFFGDAYLNFGVIGILGFSLLLAILLKIIDTVSVSMPSFLSMSILAIPAMSLINSAFFTSLLTHGILFAVLMLWLTNSFFANEIKYKRE